MKIKISLILCLILIFTGTAVAQNEPPHPQEVANPPQKIQTQPLPHMEKPQKNKRNEKFQSSVPKIQNKPKEDKAELINAVEVYFGIPADVTELSLSSIAKFRDVWG